MYALTQAQPLTQADLDRYGADEAHRLLGEMPDATPEAIAAEMETSVAKVQAWLKEPRPDERGGVAVDCAPARVHGTDAGTGGVPRLPAHF